MDTVTSQISAAKETPTKTPAATNEMQLQQTIAQVEINPAQLNELSSSNGKHHSHNNNIKTDSVTSLPAHPSNGIKLSAAQGIHYLPDRSKQETDTIELANIDTNGREINTISRGSNPCLQQSPRTMPRTHRRHLQTDIHSASASPCLPSRSNIHNYVQGQPYPAINNSSPMIGPLSATYGAKSGNFLVQSPAGFLSTNSSDSPSLQCGPDSYDSGSIVVGGMGTLSRKEAMQQKVKQII